MSEPHAFLNALPDGEAVATLDRCCGSRRWVARMLAQRPFESTEALQQAAVTTWRELSDEDHLEAFAQHPQIGQDRAALERRFGSKAALSSKEQAGVAAASAETLDALREGNLAYEAKFGFVFLVCATGKSAAEMLALLQARLPHDRPTELGIAAAEHEKITALRLGGLGA